MYRTLLLLLTIALVGRGNMAWADSSAIKAEADTTLIELVPDNNMGGHHFFNAGSTLHGHRNRALIRFNLTNEIPPGSRIQSASLVLEVVGVGIDEPASSNFRIHRVLRDWSEGNRVSLSLPGRGAPATEGEATWNHRFAVTTNTWSSPGGAAAMDYVSEMSSEQFIYTINGEQYTFDNNARMRADVQGWLDQPTQNFGWLLKAEDESIITTARRFASSEDPDYAPLLVVEFDPPPLLQIARAASELNISFQTRTNETYTLQTSASLRPVAWNSITNISGSNQVRTVTVTNALSSDSAFFRLLVNP